MAAFHYIALNATGEKQKGVIEAENSKHARQLLRDQKFILLEISEAHKKKSRSSLFKMSSKELALLTRQFATLISAGLPIEEVLTATAEQTEKQKTKGLILAIRAKILEGHSLANALRDFPNCFSDLYCATVAAGEKSGHLETVLKTLADHTEKQFSLKQKIQHALIYPSIMIFVSVCIVGFLLDYVVPKMISVYSSTKQALPFLTQCLIAMSNGIKSYGIYFLILAGIGIYFFIRALKQKIKFKEYCQLFLLRIPLIGNAMKIINTARFSRTFSILISAGIPVLEAMTIASQLITMIPIQKAVEEATHRVREGANIYLALKNTHYFPPMSLHLIASGEMSGQLSQMLERAAMNQENEVSQLIETSLALFEPAIILVMGAVVLFIVLAVLLPIFQLDQLIG